MIDTVINIAMSFAGVVIFGAALILALVGLIVVCIARKEDRHVELSLRGAGACALFIGGGVASDVFVLLIRTSLQ